MKLTNRCVPGVRNLPSPWGVGRMTDAIFLGEVSLAESAVRLFRPCHGRGNCCGRTGRRRL